MSILLELSKRHPEWLSMAIRICKDKDKAQDLVQDMYLKIGIKNKIFTKPYENYIYTTLKNINLDNEKKFCIDRTDLSTRVQFVEYNYKDYER